MRYHNIQLLRVFAAVGVVLYHLGVYGPRLAGVGREWMLFPIIVGLPVPLFFAVSGFVLAHSIQSATPGRFLFARFLRLYPGFWLALAGTLLVMWLGFYTYGHVVAVRHTSFRTVTLWPNGPGKTLYVLGIEWSLIYEVFLSAMIAGFAWVGGRRGVPILSAVWALVIAVKVIGWPGKYSAIIPHWSSIALSAYNLAFLFGVFAYQAKDLSRWWAVVVLPTVLGALYAASMLPLTAEQAWICWSVAGVGTVWLAVRCWQLPERNPLVRLGDCTYGLFLVHAPLMYLVLYNAVDRGWTDSTLLWTTGAVAILGGLAYGRLESAMHRRLRPLAKLRWNTRSTGTPLAISAVLAPTKPQRSA